jgi:hypothetical protein
VPAGEQRITHKIGHCANALAVKFLGQFAPLSWRRKNQGWRRSLAPFGQASHGTLVELFHLIAGSRLVVTGLFHMSCLALLARTPFVALPSNTHKIEGLLDDVGLPHRFIPGQNLPEALLEYARWNAGEAERVEAYIAGARRSIDEMFLAMRASVTEIHHGANEERV